MGAMRNINDLRSPTTLKEKAFNKTTLLNKNRSPRGIPLKALDLGSNSKGNLSKLPTQISTKEGIFKIYKPTKGEPEFETTPRENSESKLRFPLRSKLASRPGTARGEAPKTMLSGARKSGTGPLRKKLNKDIDPEEHQHQSNSNQNA